MLKRLQILATHIYPESQCGFRARRSTIDMVFSLKQLQEKCSEQHKPLYIVFIDLTKAFDFVRRDGLFKTLKKIGCPPTLLSIISSFHENTHSTINFDCTSCQPFRIASGVKQGCVLAPTLFGIFFSTLLQYAFQDSEDGVFLHTRSDSKLFNLARLRAKTWVKTFLIHEQLLFADDAALVSQTAEELWKLLNRFLHTCKEFGLTISIKKTNVMDQDVDNPPNVMIGGTPLHAMNTFTYLGATITSNLFLNDEITTRIAKASATMARLSKQVCENRKLTSATKICTYRACILSILLYSRETWTTYTHHEARLNSFHLCFQGASWKWHERIKYPTPRFYS